MLIRFAYISPYSSDIIDTYFENHEDEILEYEINCARKKTGGSKFTNKYIN